MYISKYALRKALPCTLIEFLKKERILCKYLNNTVEYCSKYDDFNILFEFEKLKDHINPTKVAKGMYIASHISLSFTWKNTKEDFDYWNKIYAKAYKYAKDK